MSRPRNAIREVQETIREVARQRGKELQESLGIMPTKAEVVRRPPGRPRRTAEGFHRDYRRALHHCGPEATDRELAHELGLSERWFGELVSRFGRPA